MKDFKEFHWFSDTIAKDVMTWLDQGIDFLKKSKQRFVHDSFTLRIPRNKNELVYVQMETKVNIYDFELEAFKKIMENRINFYKSV